MCSGWSWEVVSNDTRLNHTAYKRMTNTARTFVQALNEALDICMAARSQRLHAGRGHRRDGRRLWRHPRPVGEVWRGARARHAALRGSHHRCVGRLGHDGHAPRGRDHVRRLPGRVLRPARQQCGQDALHVRRPVQGVDRRAHGLRRRLWRRTRITHSRSKAGSSTCRAWSSWRRPRRPTPRGC